MTSPSHAALVNSDSIVEQRIVYDGSSEYAPPPGLVIVMETPATGPAWVGYPWNGTTFEEPPPPPPPPEPRPLPASLDDRVTALEDRVTALEDRVTALEATNA